MAIVNRKGSINIVGLDSEPVLMPNAKTSGGSLMRQVETVAIEADDDDGSSYVVARIPSNAVLSEITVLEHEAITGASNFNLGFYDPDGSVINATALRSLLSFTSQGSAKILSSIDKDRRGEEVWQLAGLSEDPHNLIDIVVTSVTVGTGAGALTMETFYTF